MKAAALGPLEPFQGDTTSLIMTEVPARAHIARARLGLVLKRCLQAPLGCMQDGRHCLGCAVERQRVRWHDTWHDPVLGRWLGLTGPSSQHSA